MSQQAAVFLGALLLGVVLGCLYDFFRITRLAFVLPSLVVLVEDLLFFLFSSVILFSYLLRVSDGQVRVFILLGAVLGWAGYYFTLGRVVMAFSGAIIQFVKKVIGWVLRPVRWLWGLITQFRARLAQKAAAGGRKLKNGLKNRMSMMYNEKKRKKQLRAQQKAQAAARAEDGERTVGPMAKTAAKTKRKSSMDAVLKLLALALLILLAVFLVRTSLSFAEMDRALEDVDAQIEQQKLVNKDMELTLRDSETYWERRARELDFAYPGEDVWVFDGADGN